MSPRSASRSTPSSDGPAPWWAAAGAIVVAALRHMRRDRTAVVFLVLLPVGLMVLMGNIYAAEDSPVPEVAVHVADPGSLTGATLDALEQGGAVVLSRTDDRSELDDAVRRRHVDAGIVLDEGGPVVLVGPPQVQLPDGVRFIVDGTVARVDRAATLAAGSTLTLEEALGELPPASVVPREDGEEARAEAVAGVLVLVTFMNLIAYASMVPTHRDLGVLGRLGVAPVRRSSIITGYGTTFVVVATVQVLAALAAGMWVVGISWGPASQVAVVVVGLVVAAGGAGVLAATLLPTPESGSTLGGPIGFALGMLGGAVWPLGFVGGVLERVGRAVPHQWALHGLEQVRSGDATVAGLFTVAAALVAVGCALAAIGARRLATFWQ